MGNNTDRKKPDLKILFDKYLGTIDRNGVIHIGAHEGQEVKEYLKQGFEKIILIEANPQWSEYLADKYEENENIDIFQYAIADKEGMLDLFIHTSRSGSNEPASIFEMKKFNQIVKTLHTSQTIKVPSITVDGLFNKYNLNVKDYSLINIDIQGAELLALKGASKILNNASAIICEVQLLELYKNAPHESEIVDFLSTKGFKKITTIYHELYDKTTYFPAWGEALFLKKGYEMA